MNGSKLSVICQICIRLKFLFWNHYSIFVAIIIKTAVLPTPSLSKLFMAKKSPNYSFNVFSFFAFTCKIVREPVS